MTKTDLINLAETTSFCADGHKIYPLYSCKACVHEIEEGKIYVLQSYHTIVSIAFVHEDTAKVYTFHYYSSTTNTTHIPRFREWLNLRFLLHHNVAHIPLYVSPSYYRSKEGKKHINCDWSDTIHEEYR